MKKSRVFLILTTLALSALLLFSSGCGVNINLDDLSAVEEALSTDSGQSGEMSAQADEPDGSAAEAAYTMADIESLENTGNFASGTLEHIFDGTINKKGKATGYHYNMITDSKGSIIEGTESEPDEHGVYTAKVEVDGVKKNGFSSFFPDDWTPQEVVDAVNEAYDYVQKNKNSSGTDLRIGYSGDLEIDMYLNNSGKITTAFPVYEGD